MKNPQTHGCCINVNGVWCYTLPDPYGNLPYFPLDAVTLAGHLDLSYRTALRICSGQRRLSRAYMVYLQVIIFGYIPDPELFRGRWFFRDGAFLSHGLPGHEFPASEVMESALMRAEYLRTAAALDEARRRIEELTALPVATSNVVAFPGRRRGLNGDGAA